MSQIAERDGIISAVRDVLSEASDDLSLQKEEKRWIKSILSLINGLNKSQSLGNLLILAPRVNVMLSLSSSIY